MKVSQSYYEDEVRDGFYVPSMMKRAWAAQIEVLEAVSAVCEKYNIQYFADAGTLLGAVRHNGFIPWDDDLDICMRREEYERFIKVAKKELPEGYVVLNIHEEPEYDELFTRIVNGRQINFDKGHLEKFHGFPYATGIDIFPLDYIAPSEAEEKTRCEMIKIVYDIAKNMNESVPKDVVDVCIDQVEKLTCCKVDKNANIKNQLFLIIEKLYALYDDKCSNEIALIPAWIEFGTNKFDKKWYETSVNIPFEHTTIPAPAMYDAILTQKYGDYMKLVRNGGLHNYPFYSTQEELLRQNGMESSLKYNFCSEDLYKKELPTDKFNKQNADNYIALLSEKHELIKKANIIGEYGIVSKMLCECQEDAIRLGTMIEEALSDNVTVAVLEKYCEFMYQSHECINDAANNGTNLESNAISVMNSSLDEMLFSISECTRKDLMKVRSEIVFLPFKASLWDSFDSVWRAAVNDEKCDVYVIPIPYYYKMPDGTYGEMNYDKDAFPSYVNITRYDQFDFAAHHPDVIYIHNPYDEFNQTTTVHSFFYSKNLKKYTNELVYIPYFKTAEIGENDERMRDSLKYFVLMPGIVNADKVIVQSENMRNEYIETLVKWAGEETRRIWENKIFGTGSPKDDYLKNVTKQDIKIPDEWADIIRKKDGSYKKIVLFTISISSVLQYEDRLIEKLRKVLDTFSENQGEIALVWQHNPLIESTLETLNMPLFKEFHDIVEQFKKGNYGIYDESHNTDRAVALSDAYYGDTCRMVQICRMAGKPVMIMKVE